MHDPLARRHQGGAVYNKIVSNEDETLTFLMGCGKYEREYLLKGKACARTFRYTSTVTT